MIAILVGMKRHLIAPPLLCGEKNVISSCLEHYFQPLQFTKASKTDLFVVVASFLEYLVDYFQLICLNYLFGTKRNQNATNS